VKTPILGESYVARSVNAAAAQMINLYPEIVKEGKEAAYLQRCPGLKWIADVGEGPIRGLWAYGGVLYAVSGDGFYKLDSTTYAPTWLGEVIGTGPVSMADNGTQLFIAANGPSYIWNAKTAVYKRIMDLDFKGAVTVGFIDGYFVFNEPNSQTIWITSLYDGLAIDPLDFASAEGNPDNVVALIVDHREVWIFGTQTVEVWYDQGSSDPAAFPLQRIQGAFNEIGCAAPYSLAKADNRLFWLGSDARGHGMVYVANGYTGQRISTHAVEWQIQSYGNLSDAVGYTYQQDGHTFYVLTFPSARDGRGATWVYDVSTNSWHERASWRNELFGRHRSNCQQYFQDNNFVGDYLDGRVYVFDPTVYSDDDQTQRWVRSWRALDSNKNDLKRTAHHSLQLDCETGTEAGPIISLTTGVLATEDLRLLETEDFQHTLLISNNRTYSPGPSDPQVMLRWSDDGGHTWSNEHWRSMGKIGQYGFRTYWRRLGMTVKLRDRVYEVSGTDPVKIAVMGAELHASPTTA
jgi:hypothetical protein